MSTLNYFCSNIPNSCAPMAVVNLLIYISGSSVGSDVLFNACHKNMRCSNVNGTPFEKSTNYIRTFARKFEYKRFFCYTKKNIMKNLDRGYPCLLYSWWHLVLCFKQGNNYVVVDNGEIKAYTSIEFELSFLRKYICKEATQTQKARKYKAIAHFVKI